MKRRLKRMQKLDDEHRERQRIINQHEAFIYDSQGRLEEEEFVQFSEEAERSEIAALLSENEDWLMDEATSSLDNGTDAMLQEVIRREFSQCTCLTIAHRLNTVMDADRICVMEKGEVKEYDSPRNLWEKEGLFHAMVVATNDRKLMEAL